MYHRRPAWLALRYNDEPWRPYYAPGYANAATARRILELLLREHGHPDADKTQHDLVASFVLPDHTHLRAIIAEKPPAPVLTPPTIAPCDPHWCHPAPREPFTHTLGHDHVGARLARALRLTGAMDVHDIHALWELVDLADLRNLGPASLGRLDYVMRNGHPPHDAVRLTKRSDPAQPHIDSLREILRNRPPIPATQRARSLLIQLENILPNTREREPGAQAC